MFTPLLYCDECNGYPDWAEVDFLAMAEIVKTPHKILSELEVQCLSCGKIGQAIYRVLDFPNGIAKAGDTFEVP